MQDDVFSKKNGGGDEGATCKWRKGSLYAFLKKVSLRNKRKVHNFFLCDIHVLLAVNKTLDKH